MSLLIFIYFSETEYNCMQYISQNTHQCLDKILFSILKWSLYLYTYYYIQCIFSGYLIAMFGAVLLCLSAGEAMPAWLHTEPAADCSDWCTACSCIQFLKSK